ncbi:hypothetical protein Ade02nite_18480 [Paractinoplanes deccanensis]|uniref:Peptidase inhibitor family I36 n=1 Tax=Paractinoplanes deccanensis TaxID=113561 RepID=A0ABQ3XZT8_9ACTN|nr:peptidase inhibitor family I36 protein [Actinoplanes deccanensis]GID73207.1 hypothetical protein Ade02nite_18480 [Actinoplanes deccanensis]
MRTTQGPKTLRRVGVVLVGALVSVGAAMAFPSAAQADRNQCRDESGLLCFWQHRNFSGVFGHVEFSNGDWRYLDGGCQEPDGRHWSNCASSIRNEGRNCEAVVYDLPNYAGASWVINRDTEAADLTQWGMPGSDNWNDKISSNNWWCG